MKRVLYILLVFFFLKNIAIAQTYSQPESVVYDAKRNCYYISNVGVQGSFDGKIITRKSDGMLEFLVQTNVLQDPKGLCIVGDTLFVADNYKLHYISLQSRTLLGSVTLSTPDIFLNDIVADEKGYIYISDTYKANIFRVKVENPNQFEKLNFIGVLSNANGMCLDRENNRILIVSYQQNALIYSLSLETFQVSVVRNSSLNYLDGITRDKDGSYYVSAWGNTTGGVYKYDKNLTEPPILVYGPLNGPADIFLDTLNNVLVIPEMGASKVHFISLSSEILSPELVFPPNNSNGLGKNVQLRFRKIFQALNYDVQVSEDATFNNLVFSSKIYDTTVIVNVSKPATKYYWRVRANTLTTQSNWSEVWNFTSPQSFFATPQLIQPINGELRANRKPTFIWSKSSQALYKLQIWENPDASGKPFIEINNIADTIFTLTTNLEMLKTYYWRLQAFSGYSNSDWSEMFMFRVNENVPNPPILYFPQNGQNNVQLNTKFIWQKTDAQNYRLQVSNVSNFSTLVIDVADLTDTIYTPDTPLKENTRYWWRVRAYNGNQGRWSETFSFVTINSTSVSNTLNDKIIIYPNPVYNSLNINSNQDIEQVMIFNIAGELIANYNISLQKTFNINMEGINSGNYYILIKSKNDNYLQKLIIQK